MKTENKSDIDSQNKRIAAHLKQRKSISPMRALNLFGCFRLSARIYDLQRPPYNLNISREMVYEHPVKFARYKLAK